MTPPLAFRDLPATARKVTQQGSTFYVIGDDRAVLRTAEGKTFYKAVDLPMVRDRQVGMTRGWTTTSRTRCSRSTTASSSST